MLELSDVRVRYDAPVLRGIDLRVDAGEIVCVLGPSGGGKSTLLRAVAGLVASGGDIRLAGRSLAGVPAYRRHIGMMFQSSLLFSHLDVGGNVGFGLTRPDPRRVAQMLDLVGLPGWEGRSVDTLSGGQAQRVALARALAPDPKVLLLDEPFGALDAVLKAGLVLDVQELLREQQVTVLAVTHDRHEAFTIADRVGVLRDGVLVQVGSPEDLWQAPVDAYVARLLGLAVLDGEVYAASRLRPDPSGRWQVQVTGRTFADGAYLVSARVGQDPLVFTCAVSQVPAVGDIVRIGVAPDQG